MKLHKITVRISTTLLVAFLLGNICSFAQDSGYEITGTVMESSSGSKLAQAVVSVASSGEFASTEEDGTFVLLLPSANEKLLINLPGYNTTEVYTQNRKSINIYLTKKGSGSYDELYASPFVGEKLSEATNSVTLINKASVDMSAESSVEHKLIGKIPGLHIVEHSGMPGHGSWMNMRGISSIFARNQPLVFIDGMIQEIALPANSLIEGQVLNPLDIVDIDDVVDVSAHRVGEGQLGGAGSNGILYINTEQNAETSASILVKMYGGIAFAPKTVDVMNADQFKTYFTDVLTTESYSATDINSMYPWLNGGAGTEEYYRYNNKTDWQNETFKPAAFQKYYLFIKGGDDIATYNISSGLLRQGGSFDQWRYNRYNLRLNGAIKITKRLSITPNTKLSLTDAFLSNMGPTIERNPYLASMQKSPLMHPNEKSTGLGTVLYPLDDVGAFNVSNPAVLVTNALGTERSFQLLTSVKLDYEITPHLYITSVVGTNVNNDRTNIFIPDVGVVQVDSAKNSPQDMATEFRSTQNHSTLNYIKTFNVDHHVNIQGGFRFMTNSYKNSISIDLNTPSDDFRSLGAGQEYTYLKMNDGETYVMNWVSYFANLGYNYQDRYYLRSSLSYDASSVFNEKNRYNFYPSVFGAWRLSSEEFMANVSGINDLKLRASYSVTGNMFSNIYNYSKLTYVGRRINNISGVVQDYNPNPNLAAEKKATINAGMDFTFAKRAVNLHVDYYTANVNNLVINQLLPYNFGFTDYYDNGGKISVRGLEVGADAKFVMGQTVLNLHATFTKQASEITEMNFINPETNFITRKVFDAEYIAEVGGPVNAFYGYMTNGVYATDADAAGIIGPNGREMGAGDVAFVDTDDDNMITDADKQYLGDPNPDYYGSFSAALSVNRFEFSALFTYSIGNDVYNRVRRELSSMDSYANQSVEVLDRWKVDGDVASLPGISLGDPKGNNVFSDRWIEDGSYLRFKEFRVSYRSPKLFSIAKPTTVYLSGTNLLTFTNYSGIDPESMYLNDPYFMGIDIGKIPLMRSVIIGIQISL